MQPLLPFNQWEAASEADMALSSPSLFLYGLEITPNNRFITFGNASLDMRVATLNLGFYSLTSLGQEVVRAMTSADPLNTYSFSVNRNVMGGTQNRFTIASSAAFLSIYFSTGNPSNPATLLGFNVADYTGSTSYTGSATCGTALIPNQLAYTYLSPNKINKNFGKLNISASGLKEAITFNLQNFFQAQFKYIPSDTFDDQWETLVQWLIQQRELEFTPMISDPTTFYVCTLEDPNTGLELNFDEMLPDFPNEYQSPVMQFRVKNES